MILCLYKQEKIPVMNKKIKKIPPSIINMEKYGLTPKECAIYLTSDLNSMYKKIKKRAMVYKIKQSLHLLMFFMMSF